MYGGFGILLQKRLFLEKKLGSLHNGAEDIGNRRVRIAEFTQVLLTLV